MSSKAARRRERLARRRRAFQAKASARAAEWERRFRHPQVQVLAPDVKLPPLRDVTPTAPPTPDLIVLGCDMGNGDRAVYSFGTERDLLVLDDRDLARAVLFHRASSLYGG